MSWCETECKKNVPFSASNLGSVLLVFFLPFFSILIAISVFLIFLTGVTSKGRRWEVVKLSLSPKRPFFFYLPGVSGVACSFLFPIAQLHLANTSMLFIS